MKKALTAPGHSCCTADTCRVHEHLNTGPRQAAQALAGCPQLLRKTGPGAGTRRRSLRLRGCECIWSKTVTWCIAPGAVERAGQGESASSALWQKAVDPQDRAGVSVLKVQLTAGAWVTKSVRQRVTCTRCSSVACAMARPSCVEVPRPSSSMMTRDREVARDRMVLVSDSSCGQGVLLSHSVQLPCAYARECRWPQQAALTEEIRVK